MIIRSYILSSLVLSILWLVSCQSDNKDGNSKEQIVVHLQQEPQRISPILETSGYERMVSEHIFLSLCDYDPVSLEMVPVLTTDVPEGVSSIGDDGTTITSYSIEILEDAVWDNGTPITGEDVVFTLKILSLPYVDSPLWKRMLESVVDIQVDKTNPKKFVVILSGDYFLQKEGILTAEIYPSHIYDGDNILKDQSFIELKGKDWEDEKEDFSIYKKFADVFSSPKMTKESGIQGAGPYKIESWETGQYIVLNKKNNWWGDQYPERTLLRAFPKKIVYQMIKDATVALTQMKGGNIDLMSLTSLPVQVYTDLQNTNKDIEKYQFETPSLFRLYYILLNNQDKRLSDKKVRKALAHLLDVDKIIDIQEGGMGTRINSPIHPKRPEYNSEIALVAYDIDEAINLLEEAQWMDRDNDGIREKITNGVEEELNLRFFITGSKLSTTISTVLKENALKAGINIEILTKSSKVTRSEHVSTGDFEMTAQVITGESKPDPFGSWHSSASGTSGSNMSGFSNDRADQLMETIRTTKDEDERSQAYREFQEIIAEEQPVLFLYAPVERIVVSKDFDPLISSKRPGFFVNSFKPIR